MEYLHNEELRQHAEDLGKIFEQMGFTPMQGRIMAYLANEGAGEKSFEDILRFFNTSKSTVSNSINYLLSAGLLDYKTRAGDRKRYFFLTSRFPVVYIRLQQDLINAFKEEVYKTLATQRIHNPENNHLIHQWIDFANRYEKYLGELKQQFMLQE